MDDEMILFPRQLLVELVALWDRKAPAHRRHGSPNHCHEVPGVWDSDNGVLAGQPCAECRIYDEARRLVAAEATLVEPVPGQPKLQKVTTVVVRTMPATPGRYLYRRKGEREWTPVYIEVERPDGLLMCINRQRAPFVTSIPVVEMDGDWAVIPVAP